MRLVKFDKTECGVDFLMKVGSPKDLVGDMSDIDSVGAVFAAELSVQRQT